MVDFTQYNPPGVYVEDVTQPLVTATGAPGSLLCIVAEAQGYQSATETVALFSATGANLSNTGVLQDSSLVLTTQSGTTLVKDADYTVSVTYPTGSDNPVTSLTRLPSSPGTASPAGVNDGDLVTVSYRYTNSLYFTPQTFTDYDLVAATYGPAMGPGTGDALSQVVSPLTLAARIAFENGAGTVMALPVQHATNGVWRDDFKSAYAKLVSNPSVGLLVAIFPDGEADTGAKLTNYLADLHTHCDAAVAEGYTRMALAGANSTYDETGAAYETVAKSTAYKRVVTTYPTRLTMFNSSNNQTVEVHGGYGAAAAGGRLAFNDVQRGLTKLSVNSFTGMPASVQQKMTRSFKDNLSRNGVCVIEQDRSGRLVFRHGVTTDMSALNSREISLVRIADTLLQNVQQGLDNAGLIGEPLDAEMPTRVKGAIQGILETNRLANVIQAWNNLLVRQQALPNGDPSVIEVVFTYAPAVPLNYVTVSFSIDLSSGAVTAADLTAAA